MNTKIIILLFLLLFIKSFSVKSQIDTTSVLFLGNSFTAANSLSNVFQQLATKAGKIVYVEDNCPGGYTLNGHSTNSTSLQKIYSRNWDYVVLQEQSQIPSFIPERDSLMYPYAITLDSLIHANSPCTKTVFFMTWAHKNGDLGLPVGSDTYEDMQQRLRSGYMTIADSLDAMLAPCGWSWRYVRQNNPGIELYSSDNYHPDITGTYLAACTFYSLFFQQSCSGIGYYAGITDTTAQYLQGAASQIVLDSLNLWNVGIYDPNPIADFTFSNLGNSVQCISNCSNTTAFFWDFGDGSSSLVSNPTHVYSDTGWFEIKLFAGNQCGTDTMIKYVYILPNSIKSSDESEYLIYPNPVLDVLIIDPVSSEGIVLIEIFSVDGSRLETRYFTREEDIKIDVSKFTEGLYFISIQGAERRIIKQFIKANGF